MDQKKIGGFLKELRKEKGITQEQLAEKFYVSSRTVSRWENGNNMPDLDILIEISDYYEIDLRDILNGERKKTMDESVFVKYNSEEERWEALRRMVGLRKVFEARVREIMARNEANVAV